MAQKVGFYDQIASLFEYGRGLRELPPNPEAGFIVPDLVEQTAWYQEWADIDNIKQAESLTEALTRLGHILGNHARAEYGPQGRDFSTQELKNDRPAERKARSRVLAAMTRPASFEEMETGTEAINSFFERMLEGAEIEIEPFGKGMYKNTPQKQTVDSSHSVYGVFEGWVRHRTLRIQYDTVRVFDPKALVLAVPLHRVVSGEGVSITL